MTEETPSQPPPRLENVESELRQAVQEVVAQLKWELLEASARLQAEIRQELQHQRAGFCEFMGSSQPQEPPGLREGSRQTIRRTIHDPPDQYSSSDSDEDPDLFATPAQRSRAQTMGYLDTKDDAKKKEDMVGSKAGSIGLGRTKTLSRLVSNKMKKQKTRSEIALEGAGQLNRHSIASTLQSSPIDHHQRKKEAMNSYPTQHHPPAAPHAPAGGSAPTSSSEPAATAATGTVTASASVDEAAGVTAGATTATSAAAPAAVRNHDAAGSSSSAAPAGAVSAGTPPAPAQPGVVTAPNGGTSALLPTAALGGAPALAQPGPDMAGGVQPLNIFIHETPSVHEVQERTPTSQSYAHEMPSHTSTGPDDGAGNLDQSPCDISPRHQKYSYSPTQHGVIHFPSSLSQRPTRNSSMLIASAVASTVLKAKKSIFDRVSGRGMMSDSDKVSPRIAPSTLTTGAQQSQASVTEHSMMANSSFRGVMSAFDDMAMRENADKELTKEAGDHSVMLSEMNKRKFSIFFSDLFSGRYSLRFVLSRVVTHWLFDWLTTFLVALNACSIGAQTDWEVNHIGEETPQAYKIIELLFCCAFSTELFLRIYVHRCHFFSVEAGGWRWNLFDTIVVIMQILDLVSSSLLGSFAPEKEAAMSKKFSFMRILRILRLVRIIRVVRILRFIRELRMMVCSIANSLRSLMWTIVLIFLMIYVVAVYLTQLVSDHGRYNPAAVTDTMPLIERYGSLWRSILSLFQAMTGGVDWEELSNPLMDSISLYLGIVFTLYIAFAVLAMMNVVTAVFIESALLRAKEDKEGELSYHMRNLMSKVDTDCSGMISWETFQYLMGDPKMQRNFRALELDLSEAKGLFHLLDIEGTGRISAEEFVTCCLQLRGPAKAIDVATLLYHNRRTSCRWKAHSRHVETSLEAILDVLFSGRNQSGHLLPPRPSRLPVSPTSHRDSNHYLSWEALKSNNKEPPKNLS